MPETTVTPADPPVAPKVETDPSKFLADAAPDPAALKRSAARPAPTDGSERFRDVGKDLANQWDFIEALWKELDAMRMSDPDTRKLKWILQAFFRRILDEMPAPKPAAPAPATPPTPAP